jgi:divalent metal cation (Fe/Co/Zn/Cd) transporter
MKNWKTKLFGDNAMNFYGWLFAGLLVCGASAWLVWRALRATDSLSTEQSFLLAIYVMFVGQFCVAWHNYLARVAEKLDAPKKKDTDDHAA